MKEYGKTSESQLKILDGVAWSTEFELFGRLNARKPQLALWREIRPGDGELISKLSLEQVGSESSWRDLRTLRAEVEFEFGVRDPLQIESLMTGIARLMKKFTSSWYLARFEGALVGEFGLIEFSTKNGRVGRLQDIDIVPRAQGRGLGTQLLNAIFKEAHKRNLPAICLKCDEDSWIKDWYLRHGFFKVGRWL